MIWGSTLIENTYEGFITSLTIVRFFAHVEKLFHFPSLIFYLESSILIQDATLKPLFPH